MSLFRGPIAWKAGKQDTIIILITEVELLGVEWTIKESLALT